MKKSIYIIFSILISNILFGQNPAEEKLRENLVKNNVQTQIQKNYKYVKGKLSKDGYVNFSKKFDRNGNTTEEIFYSRGYIDQKLHYKYDNDENKIEYANYKGDENKLLFRQNITYDNQKRKIKDLLLVFLMSRNMEDGLEMLIPLVEPCIRSWLLDIQVANKKNNKLVEDQDLNGTSIYTTVNAGKKMNLFARFDHLSSNKLEGADDAWNIGKDGQAYIFGLEYRPVKGVKISPNFQGWNPSAKDAPFESNIYLNFELSF